MTCFCGIDLGSAAIKTVIIDDAEEIVAHDIRLSGGNYHKNAMAALNALLRQTGIEQKDLARTFSTGYGRKLFTDADECISEITANALGAARIGRHTGNRLKTIINVGGQDSKVIRLNGDGIIEKFLMNDKCAAGTGRFIEMSSRNLEMSMDELSRHRLDRQNPQPVEINNTCAVFAESEIIGLLANGHQKEAVIAGVFYAVARRVARLADKVGIEDTVFFDGGAALNKGLVDALEDEIMREVVVPEIPQITTALGAALAAKRSFGG